VGAGAAAAVVGDVLAAAVVVAPATRFPSPTNSTFRANSATVAPSSPPTRPNENVVMFATTCSKPEVMNTITQAKMTMILATSFCSRPAHQMARQTMRLHMTPRKNSSVPDSSALCSIIDAIIRPAGRSGPSAPDRCRTTASTNAPIRLPTRQASSVAPARAQEIAPRTAPIVNTIIAEVASSPPATTTIVSATPNTSPCTSGVNPEPTSASGPPAVAMMTTPRPMYAPASMVFTR
jgi:hypothetical protein